MTTTALPRHHQSSHALHHDPESARLALRVDEERELEVLKKRRGRDERTWLTGRLLMAAVFLTAAVAKALTFNEVSQLIEAQGFAGPEFLLGVAIMIEAFGGALLAMGMNVQKVSLGLVVWVGLVTVLMHHDLSQAWNRASALSNIALAAGLLFLAAHGAGIRSVDQSRRTRLAENA
jgi:putative oxidoreductase